MKRVLSYIAPLLLLALGCLPVRAAAAEEAGTPDAAADASAASAPAPDAPAMPADTLQAVGAPAMPADTLQAVGAPGPMRTKRRFLPTSRRFDREINKGRFVYKGEKMVGLTVSYGTLSSEDADMFPVFENINLDGNVMTVNPFFGYFYRNNNCFGVRFGYTSISGKLDTFDVNLGDQNDLDIDIPWLDLSSERFSFGLFHRSYVALDEKGRFGLFAELELSFSTGENTFAYKSGEAVKQTNSESMTLRAGFNPGVAVYVFPNVCATLSFGLGGFKYTATDQYDAQGAKIGSRRYSKMNFKLNLADIRIGMNIHLWNKKKAIRG
ncbi:hypothetical protein [uncultured Alistipes sp.]|uniref:hypothetical protein n=1 Tax=uncultured Alistipes sp. TaxID=538949 RepID=UPI00260738B1|nr:hypothetical protein [uncultured Alistipes sp.]